MLQKNKGVDAASCAQYKGIVFLDNGGYTLEHRHYRRQKLAQKFSDLVDIVVKPIGIITALALSSYTIIQILKFFGFITEFH